MIKSGIDPHALVDLFANASQKQADQLRQGVYQATLGALQGRELSLKNIRKALATVTQAAGEGVARNPLGAVDAAALLDNALAGMDDALNKAVEANRVALGQLVARGVDLRDSHLKKALSDLDKFEGTLFDAVKKAAVAAGDPQAGPWAAVLGKLNPGATQTGAAASQAAQQLGAQLDQLHSLVRDSRVAGLKAAQALADSYTSLVSGVLMGLSDAMRQGAAAAPAKAAKAAKATKAGPR